MALFKESELITVAVIGGLAYVIINKAGLFKTVNSASNLTSNILDKANTGLNILTNPTTYTEVKSPNSQNILNFVNADRPKDDLQSAVAYDLANPMTNGSLKNLFDIPYQYLRYAVRGFTQGWN